MNLLRIFIAIEIPLEIRRAISYHTIHLRKTLGKSLVRWVPLSNIHLTLKFLGDVSKRNVEFLEQMLSAEAASHVPFSFQVKGFGVFPKIQKPRVLWVGIQAPPQLKMLYQGVEAAAARLGYEEETREFSPHLTIARVNQRINREEMQHLRDVLSRVKIPLLGTVNVEAIHLFRSELTPSGAIYTRLHSAPLGIHA